jgi:hypothetical protein
MNVVEETDNRFYIDKSTVPNGGMGCFAKVKINRGDYLEVIGVLVKCEATSDICTHYANAYKFAAEPEKEFVHALIPMGYGAMVNQADNKSSQNVSLTHLPEEVRCQHCNGEGKIRNVHFAVVCTFCGGRGKGRIVPRNANGGRVVYVALRDILPGEELLGNYNKKVGKLVMEGRSWSKEDKEEWENFLKLGLYGLHVLCE